MIKSKVIKPTEKKPARKRKPKAPPTPLGNPGKNQTGVFMPYYGTRFFCVHTGTIFTLKERDPELGLSVLKVHRRTFKRLCKMDEFRASRGLEPYYLSDMYLSDAETVLLLRGFPLPHLRLDVKLLSRENLEDAIEATNYRMAAMKSELQGLTKHRKILYELSHDNGIPVKMRAKNVKHEDYPTAIKAVKGIHKDLAAFKEFLDKENDGSRVPPGSKVIEGPTQESLKSKAVLRPRKTLASELSEQT